MYLLLKILLSAIAIAVVLETAKRSTTAGALLASLPLTSLLCTVVGYGVMSVALQRFGLKT
jgi:hypothetical protein